ncbi:MAG: transcription termination/antitermination NusG family protein [Opitutaceae bacterium]|jgi:transcription antitermination factor NusG
MAAPTISFDEQRWFVCHTKPRCEKKFSALMTAENFVHYLPLIESVRRYADRERSFSKPLFPGYVFTEIPPDRKNRIYQQDLLVRAIWVENQTLFLSQLEGVRRVVSSGLKAVLQPLLTKGTRVLITSGPLRGVEGYVEDPASPRGIVIAMDVLQQGILVPMPLSQIKILH